MTIKQIKLLKALENSKNLAEAGEKAGYSKKARNIYRRPLLQHIKTFLASDPNAIKARYEELIERCKEKGDFATERSALQDLARINSMMTDKQKIEVNNTKEDAILDAYKHNRLESIINTQQPDIP